MSSMTPDRSEILSRLLDEVTGNEEAINIRQDFCRILDVILSTQTPSRQYYTGSRAEGLNLPGSDDDFMIDINNAFNVRVVQSVHEISETTISEEFLMCTENVKPGFALLRRVRQDTVMLNPMIKAAIKILNTVEYLSSDDFVSTCMHLNKFSQGLFSGLRQGPSMEQRHIYQHPSEPGTDVVLSIHCCFWPNDASEWTKRARSFGWPTSDVISSIVDFGCHLVPVGHPKSETKLLEWRLSFSIAERNLVWSFNHIQMQCYAVLKVILKQFIKLKCNPQNQVLCSYFIKTFLFWIYETTHLNFWCRSNFHECIIYLLKEFSKCIHKGVLRHYFLPRFNLLSVKLTLEAQTELLHLLEIVMKYDINILRKCQVMQNVWFKFLFADENQMLIIINIRKTNLLMSDELMMTSLQKLMGHFRADNLYHHKTMFDAMFMKFPTIATVWLPHIDEKFILSVLPLANNAFSLVWPRLQTPYQIRNHILNLPCKSCLNILLLKYLCLKTHIESLIPVQQGNKTFYMLQQISRIDASFDVSTRQLWYAIILLKTCDYNSTLSIVNQLLSIISPCALYRPMSNETKSMYVNNFLNLTSTQVQRAGGAWLMDILFDKYMTDILPLAIQIELYFYRVKLLNYMFDKVRLSPYVCAYYLMFLCYHELGQYDNRDHALRQLIDAVNNREQCGFRGDYSYNIAGHCLLVTGQIDRARDMFNRSLLFRMTHAHLQGNCNSANWYITNFC